MTDVNFPLPFGDESSGQPDPWALPRIEPTNLIVMWPGAEAPALHQTVALLEKICGGAIKILAQPPRPKEPEILWSAVLQLPQAYHDGVPLILWAEPMRPLSDENLKFLNAESIQWAIGAETLLRPGDQLADFIALLRLLGRAFPDSPAIADVNKEGWHVRQELDEVLLPQDREPSESLLWIAHAVGVDPAPNENSKLWLYTQGLHRCGLPELEMLEVPYPFVGSALALLNGVAELIVESGMPPPGEPCEIGPDLPVTFHPWQEAAAFVNENSPGSVGNRQSHRGEPLEGVHAAMCAAPPAGADRPVWTWPSEVVQRLATQGDTAIYKTARTTQRQERLARATWDELATAFTALDPKARQDGDNRQAVFLVKAGFQRPRAKVAAQPVNENGGGREHLWFEVKRIHAGRIEGELMNQPLEIPHLHRGDTIKLDRGTVSDWQVLTRRGNFGPGSLAALRDAIQQINGALR